MKITGENVIAAPQDVVWKGLNDPEILRQSIPGCESMERTEGNAFKAAITSRIGPITARFLGNVELKDLNPPHSYTLVGSGSAGAMGSAKGVAKVSLAPEGDGTRLTYDIDADMSGKMAQLGARLIQGTVSVLAGQFFGKFGELVSGHPVVSDTGSRGSVLTSAWLWIGLVLIVIAAIALWFWH